VERRTISKERSVEEFKSRFDVAALAESMADTIRADAEAWENNTLGSFLSGLSGWLEDMHGYYEARGEETPAQPTLQTLADLLRAAKVYE
jgi:hypothetical protein